MSSSWFNTHHTFHMMIISIPRTGAQVIGAKHNTIFSVIYLQVLICSQVHMINGFISSGRSSCSDDGLLYIRGGSTHFFRFSLSPLMQLMLQVSLDYWSMGPLVHWSIGPLVHWSIIPLVRWSIGPLVQMSIRLNFCQSVPPEFLWSFLTQT